MRRNGQLVNGEMPPLCIRDGFQILEIGAAHSILRVAFVVCPSQHDLARFQEHADIIDMLVRLVVVDAGGQPEHFFRAEMIAERLRDLIAGKQGIAPLGEQTCLGREDCPLAVSVDAPALEHEMLRIKAPVSQIVT